MKAGKCYLMVASAAITRVSELSHVRGIHIRFSIVIASASFPPVLQEACRGRQQMLGPGGDGELLKVCHRLIDCFVIFDLVLVTARCGRAFLDCLFL